MTKKIDKLNERQHSFKSDDEELLEGNIYIFLQKCAKENNYLVLQIMNEWYA